MSTGDEWEDALDQIDWSSVLNDVDHELLENLAMELRFCTYEALKQSSMILGEGYYLTHLSDGTLAFWHEERYVQEDVTFFETGQHFIHHAIEHFHLEGENLEVLVQMISESRPLKVCSHCQFQFNSDEPARQELGMESIIDEEGGKVIEYCSPQCAIDAMVSEMKQG
ncbi:hypothetical protein SAMN05444487_101399 [Marininema mesophilum]|uniref:Uncharacterized protein n=1 Tax=Marininema mesophilum TaxID=1048340 RepID=A0A1H2R707_9BACL|nr:hypothetical protein [Marininema mesophilum]SDW15232.1 hypothetical protein SAMN05444487_101399 [Marininema mesophilum]